MAGACPRFEDLPSLDEMRASLADVRHVMEDVVGTLECAMLCVWTAASQVETDRFNLEEERRRDLLRSCTPSADSRALFDSYGSRCWEKIDEHLEVGIDEQQHEDAIGRFYLQSSCSTDGIAEKWREDMATSLLQLPRVGMGSSLTVPAHSSVHGSGLLGCGVPEGQALDEFRIREPGGRGFAPGPDCNDISGGFPSPMEAEAQWASCQSASCASSGTKPTLSDYANLAPKFAISKNDPALLGSSLYLLAEDLVKSQHLREPGSPQQQQQQQQQTRQQCSLQPPSPPQGRRDEEPCDKEPQLSRPQGSPHSKMQLEPQLLPEPQQQQPEWSPPWPAAPSLLMAWQAPPPPKVDRAASGAERLNIGQGQDDRSSPKPQHEGVAAGEFSGHTSWREGPATSEHSGSTLQHEGAAEGERSSRKPQREDSAMGQRSGSTPQREGAAEGERSSRKPQREDSAMGERSGSTPQREGSAAGERSSRALQREGAAAGKRSSRALQRRGAAAGANSGHMLQHTLQPNPSQVIVFGGYPDSHMPESTEMLSGTAQAFEPAALAHFHVYSHCAVVLDSQRVILLGGSNASGQPISTTILFDIAKLAFEKGPKMCVPRASAAAAPLDCRRVLVVGGCKRKMEPVASTEILDIGSMTFSPGPELLHANCHCAMAPLDEKTLVIAGGKSKQRQDRFSTTELFDTETMSFKTGPTMCCARASCAAAAIGQSRVMVVGGFDGRCCLSSTEILDGKSMVFTLGPPLQMGRSSCMAIVHQGHLLVLGGVDKSNQSRPLCTDKLDLSDPVEFEPGPLLCTPRVAAAAVTCCTGPPE